MSSIKLVSVIFFCLAFLSLSFASSTESSFSRDDVDGDWSDLEAPENLALQKLAERNDQDLEDLTAELKDDNASDLSLEETQTAEEEETSDMENLTPSVDLALDKGDENVVSQIAASNDQSEQEDEQIDDNETELSLEEDQQNVDEDNIDQDVSAEPVDEVADVAVASPEAVDAQLASPAVEAVPADVAPAVEASPEQQNVNNEENNKAVEQDNNNVVQENEQENVETDALAQPQITASQVQADFEKREMEAALNGYLVSESNNDADESSVSEDSQEDEQVDENSQQDDQETVDENSQQDSQQQQQQEANFEEADEQSEETAADSKSFEEPEQVAENENVEQADSVQFVRLG